MRPIADQLPYQRAQEPRIDAIQLNAIRPFYITQTGLPDLLHISPIRHRVDSPRKLLIK